MVWLKEQKPFLAFLNRSASLPILLIFRSAMFLDVKKPVSSPLSPETKDSEAPSMFSPYHHNIWCVWLSWNLCMLTWPQLSQWRDVDHPIPQIQTLLCPQFEFVCWLLMSNHSISPPLPSVPSVSTSLVCLFIKSLASAYGHFNERLCCNGWPSPVHNL